MKNKRNIWIDYNLISLKYVLEIKKMENNIKENLIKRYSSVKVIYALSLKH